MFIECFVNSVYVPPITALLDQPVDLCNSEYFVEYVIHA
jgi:hypothetical protein